MYGPKWFSFLLVAREGRQVHVVDGGVDISVYQKERERFRTMLWERRRVFKRLGHFNGFLGWRVVVGEAILVRLWLLR